MLIGYARVSTLDQNLDLQRDALTKAGCERLFEEKKSGKAGTKRPEFEAALAYLRPEDVLVVWKLDRLGRSLVEMMRTIDGLRVKDVHFRSLTEQFDSATAHGRFALQMHGAMAEYFLDLNRERTMEGLKAALARGRKGGRPKKLSEADLDGRPAPCWRPARSAWPTSPSGSGSTGTPSTATSRARGPTAPSPEAERVAPYRGPYFPDASPPFYSREISSISASSGLGSWYERPIASSITYCGR